MESPPSAVDAKVLILRLLVTPDKLPGNSLPEVSGVILRLLVAPQMYHLQARCLKMLYSSMVSGKRKTLYSYIHSHNRTHTALGHGKSMLCVSAFAVVQRTV